MHCGRAKCTNSGEIRENSGECVHFARPQCITLPICDKVYANVLTYQILFFHQWWHIAVGEVFSLLQKSLVKTFFIVHYNNQLWSET